MVETILDTATLIISDPSKPKISANLIAQTAGIAVGSLYQFFPNIEAVRVALIERVMDRLFEKLVEEWSSIETLSDLASVGEKLVSATYELYYQYPDIVKIIIASKATPEFYQVNERLNNRLLSVIIEKLIAFDDSLDAAELRRQVLITLQIGDVMTMLIWTSETEEERLAYLHEWKTLVRVYIQNMINEHS